MDTAARVKASTAYRIPAHYTLSLHDPLPICGGKRIRTLVPATQTARARPSLEPGAHAHQAPRTVLHAPAVRSEEHTSELQSRGHLVIRLRVENKNAQGSRSFTQIEIWIFPEA